MTLCFPDLNVWLALSIESHEHFNRAWHWLNHQPEDAKFVFSRHTQIGLLRLLASQSAMGEAVLTLGQAWKLYDGWLADPRVDFYPEPRDVDLAFRRITSAFAAQRATKVVGDCWLLAFAMGINATLVTFDRGLYELCRKQGHTAVIPA